MAMMGPVDALLCFGECALKDAAALPNTLDLNKAQTERMRVEVQVEEAAAGGTSIALKLEGSNDNSEFVTVGAALTVTTAEMTAGATFSLPIPDGKNYRYYKVTCAKTGSFTAGKLTAYIDPYMGI